MVYLLLCLKTSHWLLCFSSVAHLLIPLIRLFPAVQPSMSTRLPWGRGTKGSTPVSSKQIHKNPNRHCTVSRDSLPQGSCKSAGGEQASLCFCSALSTTVLAVHTACRKALESIVQTAFQNFSQVSPLSLSTAEGQDPDDYKWPVPPSYCCTLWEFSFCSPVSWWCSPGYTCTPELCLGASNAFIYVMHWFVQFAMNHWCLLGTHTRFWLFLLQCYNGHKDT